MEELDPRNMKKKLIKYWTEVRDKWKQKAEELEVRLKRAEEMGAHKKRSKWNIEYKNIKKEWKEACKIWTESDEHLLTLDKEV